MKYKEDEFIKKCPHNKWFTHVGSALDKKSAVYICPDCNEQYIVSKKEMLAT